MTRKPRPNPLEESIRARLTNVAKSQGLEAEFLFTRYALERFLYRLGLSPHRDRFVLKGATLFQLWTGQTHRPTRDIDLLGQGHLTAESVSNIFKEICLQSVPTPDAVVFHPESLVIEPIREDQEYAGLRITFQATLATAKLRMQVDIGTGDAVTPAAALSEYPSLLDLPSPRLRTYPPETAVAEKFQAMVMLGIANTRIKDFYDLFILARDFAFDGTTLASAMSATFARRQTKLPEETPIALTSAFWQTGAKWRAFLSRHKLPAADIAEVTSLLTRFLMPPATTRPFNQSWPPGGPLGLISPPHWYYNNLPLGAFTSQSHKPASSSPHTAGHWPPSPFRPPGR